MAYHDRHGAEPVRNKTINSQLKAFVERVGADAAPHVAKFYVSHSEQFYVRSRHPVNLLLRDAEKLHTEWKTGSQMTGPEARDIERRQSMNDNIDQAFDMLAQRGIRFAT